MMWKEFEEIAGYEVSYKDYTEIIEPMYMATSLNKEQFVACLDKSRFALKTEKQLVAGMRKEAKHLKEICGKCNDYESEDRLNDLIREYEERFNCCSNIENGYEIPQYNAGCTYPRYLMIYSKSGAWMKDIKLAV